jgi:hypothetical protein
VLPADARLCLVQDLLRAVVQVMQLTGGRHLLSPDGPGSVGEGSCASGDAVDVGGYRSIRGKRNRRLEY